MAYRIEVSPLNRANERAASLLAQIRVLGVDEVERVEETRLYFLDGPLIRADVDRIAHGVLTDDVVETCAIVTVEDYVSPRPAGSRVVEVSPKPGVTDSVAETLARAAEVIGVQSLTATATGTKYTLFGDISDAAVDRLARGLFANEMVQQWHIDGAVLPPFAHGESPRHVVEILPVREVDDDGLLALSEARRLALNLLEMRGVQAYYRDQGRDPTDLELEMLAQTWSEHCVHKTFRARIEYEERDEAGQVIEGSQRVIDSMLKSFLMAATDRANKPWIRSAFVDNAGIVAFDESLDLALKVETHNHPSALEPFGGANTGVGGCVRDILGVSARPIANTDVLCFGPGDIDPASLPSGVLHPRRIAAGVIAGVEDYGNKMGIPTVAGAIVYDPGYTANPLVFVGCLGVLPHGSHPTAPQPGDYVVVLGGRTGRDGLRGATFSSMEMTHETSELAGSAVQIGHPINEKQVQEVVCEARDQRLYNAITDCGAGGLSSSVGEMAETLGATVQLETVPVKYPGLQPWEVWLSEAQERMVMAVPEKSWAPLVAVCHRHGVEATRIGHFTGDGVLTVKHEEEVVGQLQTHFLHDGIPQRRMKAVRTVRPTRPIDLQLDDPTAALLALLASANIRSREDVVRQYDHEVQGGTVVKPLVGVEGHGPGDGAVLLPLAARQVGRLDRGVALGCGINPAYGAIDPYRMAWAAVDEAVRNVVSVGGDPDTLSLVDNFCWGNPNRPDRLGGLVRCGEGCRDAAFAFDAPYISGKDSLNNEYTGADGQRHAIPGTILITTIAIVPDVTKTATSAFKGAGNAVLLVGRTQGELGGSAIAQHLGLEGGEAPRPVESALETARAVHRVLTSGRVATCHDLSEGGLAVGLAEMALGGRIGATVDLGEVVADTRLNAVTVAFCESSSRYVLEVAPDALEAVTALIGDVPHSVIGETGGDALRITDGREELFSAPVGALESAFR